MANENEELVPVQDPELEVLFDGLEAHENEDIRRLAKAIRAFDHVPSSAGTWSELVAKQDAAVTRSGGTDVVFRFLKLDTAKSTFITSNTRDKMTKYLERFVDERRAVIPNDAGLTRLGEEYGKMADSTRQFLQDE